MCLLAADGGARLGGVVGERDGVGAGEGTGDGEGEGEGESSE